MKRFLLVALPLALFSVVNISCAQTPQEERDALIGLHNSTDGA